MIVEDKRNMAQMLRRALEEKSHSAVLAFTGKDALAQVQAGGFDAVVLNLMLPDIDGFEVARRIYQEKICLTYLKDSIELISRGRCPVPDSASRLQNGLQMVIRQRFKLKVP